MANNADYLGCVEAIFSCPPPVLVRWCWGLVLAKNRYNISNFLQVQLSDNFTTSNMIYMCKIIHYSKKLKEHFDIMIFIECYPLERCKGCVKLIASKVNCFLNITDLSEVQLCMSSNSWTWECPHTKDGADHVPLIYLSSVKSLDGWTPMLFLF